MNDAPPAEVAALRAEIDATDDALHALLIQRAAVVERLRASGVKSGHPLRPGREAAILRRLFGRHDGPLPRAALFRVWREILASSLAQQGGFTVAALPSVEAVARAHFGLGTPLRPQATPARALAALSSGEASVAVLPMPGEEEPPEAAWWLGLDATRLSVIAKLPFLAAPGAAPALVVSPSAPDPSGEDRTLLRFALPDGASRANVSAALTAAGLTTHLLLIRREVGRVLIEVEGFWAPGDARLAALPFAPCDVLGATANPSLDV
jgi:chorismate mutase / prephenate dehydratase